MFVLMQGSKIKTISVSPIFVRFDSCTSSLLGHQLGPNYRGRVDRIMFQNLSAHYPTCSWLGIEHFILRLHYG